MLLPEGIHRENTKMYEEVEIPPNEPMPIGFEERPVYIAELDEVGPHPGTRTTTSSSSSTLVLN